MKNAQGMGLLTWQPRISSGPVDRSASTKGDLRSDHGFSANTFLGSAGGDRRWPFRLYIEKKKEKKFSNRTVQRGLRVVCDLDDERTRLRLRCGSVQESFLGKDAPGC